MSRLKVVLEVLAERRRQINVEGYSPERDLAHGHHALARAAGSYCCAASGEVNGHDYRTNLPPGRPLGLWPWEKEAWKPKNDRADLVRAAALILAAIEVLDAKP